MRDPDAGPDGAVRDDVERSLLSTLLLDPTRVGAIRERGIEREQYRRPAHRVLYRALVSGVLDDVPRDGGADDRLPLIAAALNRGGFLDAVGGLAALAHIYDAAGSAELAEQYAAELLRIDAAERKRELHERAARGDGSADDELRTLYQRGSGHRRTGGAPVLVSLSTVEPRAIAWLWAGRIPSSKLSILDGDPGLGKSSVTLDLAARVTTGRPMPDGSPCGAEGAVILLTYEDDLADTVRPRFDAAGGDPERVYGFTVTTDDGERLPELPRDLDALEVSIRERAAVLVVIDPLMAALAGEVNAHRDQDVRRALSPLAKMAERTGAAVLVVRHLNKGGGGTANPLYRGGGSIGIIGAARSGLLVARDPKDADRRVLAVTKANLAAPAPALSFRTRASGLGLSIDWLGIAECSADELLAAPGDPAERSALDDAGAWLASELADGERPARDVMRAARAVGIGERTLDRAARSLGVVRRRQGFGRGAAYVWALRGPCSPHAAHAHHDPDTGEHGEHESGPLPAAGEL